MPSQRLTPVGDFSVNGQFGVMVPPGTDPGGVALRPMSSTRAGQVPTAVGTTNRFFVAATTPGTGYHLSNFCVDARAGQGHNFHGLRVQTLTDATLENVTVRGAFGSGGANPNETFAVPVYDCHRVLTDRLLVDGNGTAASGVGHSRSSDVTHRGLRVVGCLGWGMTSWRHTGALHTEDMYLANGRGLNHELVDTEDVVHTGVTIHLLDTPFGGNTRHLTVATNLITDASNWQIWIKDWSGGLYGPGRPSPFVCSIGPRYLGRPNPTVAPPQFWGPDGNPMLVADQGRPARDGLAAIPPSNLDRLAAADPAELRHWVFVQRSRTSP